LQVAISMRWQEKRGAVQDALARGRRQLDGAGWAGCIGLLLSRLLLLRVVGLRKRPLPGPEPDFGTENGLFQWVKITILLLTPTEISR